MKIAERRLVLVRLGFVKERSGSKHEVYVHPPTGTRAMLPRSTKDGDYRGWRNERARLRRAGFKV